MRLRPRNHQADETVSAILLQLSAQQHQAAKAAARRDGITLQQWAIGAVLGALDASESLKALTTAQMVRQIHKRVCIDDSAPLAAKIKSPAF